MIRVWTAGLEDRKPDQPIIVFNSIAPVRSWSAVLHDVAAFAPVVAYDRPGLGVSEWDEATPTNEHLSEKLRGLLEEIGAEPPYVMVGNGWGAPLATELAGRHPDEVVGLVLTDPAVAPAVTREAAEEIGAGQEGYEAIIAHIQSLTASAPPPMQAQAKLVADLMEQEDDLPRTPEMPVAVVLGAGSTSWMSLPPDVAEQLPFDFGAFREAELDRWISRVNEWVLDAPEGYVMVTNTGAPAIHLYQPDLLISAIRRVAFPNIERQMIAALEQEDVEAAVDAYRALKDWYPAARFEDDHLLLRPAYTLMMRGETEAALRLFELNVEEHPDQPYPHFSLGEAYAEAGRMEEARVHLHTALQLGDELGDSTLPEFHEALMQAIEPPYRLSAPEGWQPQISPLPRDFAPDLAYRGVADYQYAPGMFEPESEGYFSYVMVWWLEGAPALNERTLEQDLEAYFHGLATAYADRPSDRLRTEVELQPVTDEGGWQQRYRGEIETFDALAADAPVDLTVRTHLRECAASNHRVVFVEVSPQPQSHAVWNDFTNLRQQFRCADGD